MLFVLAPNCGTVCSLLYITPLRLLHLTDGSMGAQSIYVPVCVCMCTCIFFSASAHVQMCALFTHLCFAFVCVFDKRSLQHWNVSALISAWFSPGVSGVKTSPQECRQSWGLEINTAELWRKTDVLFGDCEYYYGSRSHEQPLFTKCFWVKNKQQAYRLFRRTK